MNNTSLTNGIIIGTACFVASLMFGIIYKFLSKNSELETGKKLVFLGAEWIFYIIIFSALSTIYHKFHLQGLLLLLVISCFLSLLPLYSYWVTPFFLVLRKDVRTAQQSIKDWVNIKYPGLNKVYVYNREPVNAFAIGLFGRSRRILIHQKLVDELPQEQVQAILAHEIAHLQNRHLYLSYLIHVAGLLTISSAMRPLYSAGFSSEALRLLTIVLTSAGLAGIFFAFLPSFVMRRLEIKADRQAAKTVGVATYSAALQALFHLSERADEAGDLYHPPLKKRLAALQNI